MGLGYDTPLAVRGESYNCLSVLLVLAQFKGVQHQLKSLPCLLPGLIQRLPWSTLIRTQVASLILFPGGR